jgi:YidC/Oxa1 family membrane protein insertase
VNEQQRLILAVGLSVAVLFVWDRFFMPKRPLSHADGGAEVALLTDGGAPVLAAGIPAMAAGNPAGPSVPPPAPEAPEELVTIDQPQRTLVFSSHGGSLKHAVLKGEQFKRLMGSESVPVDLVQAGGDVPPPLSLVLGDGLPALPPGTPFRVQQSDNVAVFTARVGTLEITKRYTVSVTGYDVQLDVAVKNVGEAPVRGLLGVALTSYELRKGTGGGFFSSAAPEGLTPVFRLEGKTERQAKDKDKAAAEYHKGAVSFVGLDERYFLMALYPTFTNDLEMKASSQEIGARHAEVATTVALAPGAMESRTFGLFLGPKLQETLEAAGQGTPALQAAKPQLETSLDYGFVAVICSILLKVLRAFHSLVPNWGVAIILLTLSVKLAMFPITQKQMAGMEGMRKLQPQIEAIKKQFPDDQERVGVETMKLYSQAGVSPLSGCLPMLIQMPVWMGLYRTLEYAFDLYRQPFIAGWINDLTAMDGTYILPLLMAGSMFLTQRMQPQMGGDPAQAKMMLYAMPIFFGFVMKSLPAGLNLYILCNNVLSVAQQTYLRRKMANMPAPTPSPTPST